MDSTGDEPVSGLKLELRYSLTAADLEGAWAGHRPLWGVELPASIAFVALGVLMLSLDAERPFGWATCAAGVVMLVRHLLLRQRLHTAWRQSSQALSPVHLSVSEEGILARTPHLETRAAWDAYTDAHEIGSGFLLYRGHNFAFVPDRAFGSAAEVEAFRSMIGRHVEGPRWRRLQDRRTPMR